eukprot:GEMP01071767.1.p1 GENE.GEMP01071767.1~~GEMP01071767.1.p1  ORF type:complete len:223 (+),score=28.40 GEMP01071767.1:84-752(+)
MGSKLILDISDGINGYTQRAALKQLFQQFGTVDQCFIGDRRHNGSYVKFMTETGAEDAQQASEMGYLILHGTTLRTRRRSSGPDEKNISAASKVTERRRSLYNNKSGSPSVSQTRKPLVTPSRSRSHTHLPDKRLSKDSRSRRLSKATRSASRSHRKSRRRKSRPRSRRRSRSRRLSKSTRSASRSHRKSRRRKSQPRSRRRSPSHTHKRSRPSRSRRRSPS